MLVDRNEATIFTVYKVTQTNSFWRKQQKKKSRAKLL